MKQLLLVLVIFLSLSGNSQVNRFLRTYSGTNTEEVLDLESDAIGNTYTCGHFSGFTNFGSVSLTATNLSDGFICKLDPAGSTTWAIKLGGSGFDRVVALALKPSGNIIATGVFDGTATFGSFTLNSQGNTQDIFVVEIQPDGTVLWAKSISGDGQDVVTGLCIDGAGKAFISAQFRGTITVGNSSYSSLLNDTTQQSSYDILFFRLDQSGQFDWSLQGADHYDSRGLKTVADGFGNYYALIEYSDTLQFQNQSLLPGGINGIALLKLNDLGKLEWTRRFLSPKSEPNDITLKDNKIYVAGNFSGGLHLPDNGGFSFPTSYTNHYFVASFGTDGTLSQQISGGSDNFLRLTSIAIDNANAVYIGGNFGCSFTELTKLYGSGIFNSAGYQDIWYGKISADGQKLWFQQYGGRGQDELWDMGMRDIDRPMLCGSFERKLNVPAGNETGNSSSGSRFEAQYQPANYCTTSNYRIYRQISATGNKDGFVIDWHSPDRLPYDFYRRSGSPCNRDQMPTYISPRKDTILSCEGGIVAVDQVVDASVLIGNPPSTGPDREHAPEFSYFWNGVEGARSFSVPNYTGNIYLEARTKDGCFSFRDTIYRIDFPVNSVSITSRPYEIFQLSDTEPGECPYLLILPQNKKDTLEAHINNSQFEYHWRLPNGEIRHGKTLEISAPGLYQVTAETGDSLCLRSRCLKVIGIAFDSLNEAILNGLMVPKLDIPGLRNDTLYICNNKDIRVNLIDSLTGLPIEIPLLGAWSSTGLIEIETGFTFIKHTRRYRDNTTGWNTVQLDLYIPGLMQQYLIRLSKQFYTVVGNGSTKVGYTLTPTEPTFCTGKPLKVIIDGPKPFKWLTYASESNPTVANPLDVDPYSPFFLANGPGTYRIRKDSTDSLTGCLHSITGTLLLQTRKAPQITTNPSNGYLCPNDSILLTGAQGTEHVWYGPTGEGAPGDRTIYAHAPGNYAYAFTDSFGCRLTSGTIVINEYRVPPLSAEKDHICPGDSIKISIITYPGLQYVWNNPPGVVKPFIYAKTPGYYSASYTFCGTTQSNGVQITGSTEVTGIIAETSPFCEGDAVWLRAKYPGWSNKWLPANKDTSALLVQEDGTITLRSVDPQGCISQAAFQVDFLSPPEPLEILNSGTFCIGETVQLVSNTENTRWILAQDTSSGSTYSLYITADTILLRLLAIDPVSGCVSEPVVLSVAGKPSLTEEIILGETVLCSGAPLLLFPSFIHPGVDRYWLFPDGDTLQTDTLLVSSDQLNDQDQIILVTGPDPDWCGIKRDTIRLSINPSAPIQGLPDSLIVCAGDSVLLKPNQEISGATYVWFGPAAFQSNEPEIRLNNLQTGNLGIYHLQASLGNCINRDSVFVLVNPLPPEASLQFSGAFCLQDTIVIQAETPVGTDGFWIFNGDTINADLLKLFVDQQLKSKQGIFRYYQNGCISIPAYFTISEVFNPQSGLPDSVITCRNDLVQLTLSESQNWQEVEWSNGESGKVVQFKAENGVIEVVARTTEGCEIKDTVVVYALECNTVLENVFSPDGDGINDYFLFPGEGVITQKVIIFNRWGNLIWEAGGKSLAWNGKNDSGEVLPEGTYFYLAEITYINGMVKEWKGTIALFH